MSEHYNIFREYDIMGLVDKELNPDLVESIGKADEV